MFTEVKRQFIDGLDEQTWMDSTTRAQARLKVSDRPLTLIDLKAVGCSEFKLYMALNFYA